MGTWLTCNIAGQDATRDIGRQKRILLTSPPNGSTVHTVHPTFYWQTLPEAYSYRFQMSVITNGELVDLQVALLTNSYQTVVTLSNGVCYTWWVGVSDRQDNFIGYSPLTFAFIAAP
jgi:hypothetical protein